ncbi:MAG: hypothetical protein IH991_23215 [Planctomycetes bacterium]|nr:hypothetical protein [Planctomycetota bacterium]
MGFAETLIFYTVIGIGVAVALLAVEADRTAAQRMFMAATAILFWPVYVPVLLGGGRSSPTQSRESPANDKVSQLVDQVQQELDEAVYRFDGWDDDSLANQRERISELKAAWRAQADRIREIDGLLSQLKNWNRDGIVPEEVNNRVSESEQARRDNLERIQEVRRAAYEELMSSLACAREVASIVCLARVTDASALRADQIACQLAAAARNLTKESSQQLQPASRIATTR